MKYLAWVTPGYSYYGSGTTQSKLNAGFVSWGLMGSLPAIVGKWTSNLSLSLLTQLSLAVRI